MKKIISVMLLLAMVLGLFAGCGKDEKTNTGLTSAAEYLTTMYQTASKDEAILITADQDVLKSLVIDGTTYAVEWAVEVTEGDAESVKVAESKKENHVKLDIPLHAGSDILFTATATISDAEGETTTVSLNYKVAGVELAGEGMTMEELVEAAYNLDQGEALEGLGVLTGVVSMINTPYDDGYKNLTVTMIIGDLTDMPIKCYRLKGDGAETIAVGDTITVSGTLKNYNGTIEFDAGCMLDELIKGNPPIVEAPADPMQIIQEAYALEDGTSLGYEATLTGKIISVDTPYDAGYQNVTVTIAVTGCEDMPIKCYRLKGTGADTIAVGDEITVTGTLTKYNGVVEFAQGCTLDTAPAVTPGPAPTDPLQIVDEAYLLATDTALTYQPTLTGKITTIDTPYDATYQNVTVTMIITGREAKPIQCFRLKGTGADTLAVGDTITVSGVLKNYAGKVQFDANCMLTNVVKGNPVPVDIPTDPLAIIDAGYALAENAELPYNCSLTGKVSSVDTAYDATYKNVTVTIKVGGRDNKPIQCYRIGGTGADKVKAGDTITVVGKLKNYNGKVQLINGTITGYKAGNGSNPVAPTDPKQIVDIAYGLAKDTQMAYDVTLTGRVSAVKTAYDANFGNITVEMLITGRESKPILAYRLKGTGCDQIAVGDTIQVVGRIKNYNGTIEFDAGCTLLSRKSGGGAPVVTETDPAKIMAAAGKLAENAELPYKVTLSGKVTGVNEAYNAEYQNITVTINVNGANQPLKIYRLKGDGADKLAAGDTITVEGTIKNYNGELEMVNCTMTARTSGGGAPVIQETDPARIMAAAEALAENTELPYKVTLSGKVTAIKSPYDSEYGNISFDISVDGTSKTLYCYRVKGDYASKIVVNDKVTLEGNIKNYNGLIELVNGNTTKWTSGGGTVQIAPSDPKQIVDAAYALAPGSALPYKATLTGKIISIDDAYSSQYNNITVTIAVAGKEDKPIKCYRLKGDGVASLAVGNTITVSGTIKNYQHSSGECEIEFDLGCTLQSVTRSGGSLAADVTTQLPLSNAGNEAVETNAQKILTEAYALEKGKSLSYKSSLTGKITSIDSPYSSQYKNISVIIEVPGYPEMPMLCYRIKGEGADTLAVGDTITVSGTITNYNGKIEFTAGSTLDNVVPGGGEVAVAPEDPKQIVDEAYALPGGASLPYNAILTGTIISVDKAYDEQYKNITVTITIPGRENKPIECYRLKGEGAETLKVGDVITVEGVLKNYVKTDAETGETTSKVEFNGPSLLEIGADLGGDNTGDTTATNMTVQVKAHASWAECYVYSWNPEAFGGWPGTKLVADANGIYSFEMTAAVGGMVIGAGNGKPQTVDITDLTFVAGTTQAITIGDTGADGKHTYTYGITSDDQGGNEGSGDEGDAPITSKEIMDAAYALESGETLDGTYTLVGSISTIDTPWSDQYGNITVSITVEGKALKCFRLAGEGAKELAIGDIITVTGSITNYNGSVQFAQGCTLDNVVKSGNVTPVAPSDPKEIVDAAYALEGGAVLPYEATLTGKLTEIVEAYTEQYGNITVKLVIEGREDKPILCYRMKGEGVETLKVGDTITVTGNIKNYVKTNADTGETTSTIEFTPCTLTAVNAGTGDNTGDNTGNNGGTTTDKTQAQIVDEAYALAAGEKLPYTAVLTGKIISVDTAWSDQFKNITVTIAVAGKEDKPIQCYRLAGEGAKDLKVGDTINVSGVLFHYVKTDEATGEVVADKIEFEQGCTLVKDAGNNGNTGNTGNTGNNGNTGNTGNSGNTGNKGDKAPGTGDFMLTGLFATIALAGTALVALKKKED